MSSTNHTLSNSTHSYESFTDLNSNSTPPSHSRRTSSTRRISLLFSSSSPASSPSATDSRKVSTVETLDDQEPNLARKLTWRRYGSMGGSGLPIGAISDDEEGDNDHSEEDDNTIAIEREGRDEEDRKDWLSTWDLIGLTIGLAGAQLTWTVEMALVKKHS